MDLLADFDSVGRVRFDDAARVVGIAWLSIVPTRHRLDIADGYGSDSVVDIWCPTVNLFADVVAGITWAGAHGVSGQPAPVEDLEGGATMMWTPLASSV